MRASELADTIGVSRGTVSLWLSGKRNPSFERKEEICRVFNVTYIELVHTEEELAIARLNHFFRMFNLDIDDFERFEELEKEISKYFIDSIGKFRKKGVD